MRDALTRRQALIGTGALAVTGSLGIVTTSNNATATVSGDFTIPNGETVLADATLEDVRLSADVSWGYQSNAPIHNVEIELHVGATTDTLDLIARHTKSDLSEASLTGETELNGSLMSASDFSIQDFQPGSGEITRSVIAELRFYALRDGGVVAEATQRTTFDITVSAEELQVEISMNATGEVTFTTS